MAWHRMPTSLARGYKLALLTLAAELALALLLVSDSLAIVALLAMAFVGIAWLPSALMILSDLMREPRPGVFGFAIAGACGLIGAGCLLFLLRAVATAAFLM